MHRGFVDERIGRVRGAPLVGRVIGVVDRDDRAADLAEVPHAFGRAGGADRRREEDEAVRVLRVDDDFAVAHKPVPGILGEEAGRGLGPFGDRRVAEGLGNREVDVGGHVARFGGVVVPGDGAADELGLVADAGAATDRADDGVAEEPEGAVSEIDGMGDVAGVPGLGAGEGRVPGGVALHLTQGEQADRDDEWKRLHELMVRHKGAATRRLRRSRGSGSISRLMACQLVIAAE